MRIKNVHYYYYYCLQQCVEIVDVLVKTVIEDLARGISNPLETCHALEMC